MLEIKEVLRAWLDGAGLRTVANRVGCAGSFTASDHVAVLDAALEQIPANHQRDVLVTVDGADASHGFIADLHSLNTAASHGARGRRVEYSIWWPIDARTRGAIEQLREQDWSAALTAAGEADEQALVAELTGVGRHSTGGHQLAGGPSRGRPARPG